MTRKYAADDANLNAAAIITSRRKDYVDLNLYFEANTSTKDIYLSKDAQAVKQSVRNLILTNHNEVPFRPNQGANIRALLFENIGSFAAIQAKSAIASAIANTEPRAQVLDINVNFNEDGNSAAITIEFQVRTTQEQVTLAIQLKRLR
jgi:phage baseplate assembly protein W